VTPGARMLSKLWKQSSHSLPLCATSDTESSRYRYRAFAEAIAAPCVCAAVQGAALLDSIPGKPAGGAGEHREVEGLLDKRNRRLRSLVSAAAIAVAIAVLGGGVSSPAGAAADAGQGERLDALVVNRAGNRVFDAFLDRSNARVTRTPNARTRSARRYDLVVLDGDVLSAGEMASREELDDFADRGRWVLALDVEKRDHQRALEQETSFSALGADGGHNSEAFLFRRSLVGTSPLVRMLDAGPLSKLPGGLNGKQRREVRKRHALNAAKEIESFVNADEAQPLAAGAAAGGGSTDLVQSRQWEFTRQDSEPAPPGYYSVERERILHKDTQGLKPYDPPRVVFTDLPRPHLQLPSWTMTHTFGVYLDNGRGNPQGNHQIVTYDLKGQFSPKPISEPFFHMFDTFRLANCALVRPPPPEHGLPPPPLAAVL